MKLILPNIARTFRSMGLLVTAALISLNAYAQPINEGFTNVQSLYTSGWAQQNLSNPLGASTWVQGNPTVFIANSSPDTSYVACNFNSTTGAGTISNWLFTPTRTFNNGDIVTFFTRGSGGTYPDALQMRFSTNGASVNVGTTETSVGDFTNLLVDINPTLTTTGYPSTWTQYSATISGLAGPTSGRIAFRYFVTNGGPSGSNSDYIGIDDYVYTPAGTGAAEVGITSVTPGQYTLIPESQVSNFNVSAVVNNSGTASAASVNLVANVYKLPSLVPVYTQTGSTSNLNAGASTNISLPVFTPSAPLQGDYVFEYIISGNTGSNAANDTFYYGVTVDANWYARDNGNSVNGIGGGPTLAVSIGNNFQVNNTAVLDSVLFFCYPQAAGLGDTVRVRITSTSAGVPSNTGYLGQSAFYFFTVQDTGGAVITLPVTNLTGGALSLAPGTYSVLLEESYTGDNYGLQLADEIFTPNTVYANINNGAFSTLSSLGFPGTPIIRAFLRPSCTITSSATATNATCTAANGTATVNVTGGTAPFTYAWSNGGSASTESNLIAGNYSVTVTDASNCPATSTVTVGSTNTVLNGTSSSTSSACGGATGSVTVNPSNGTAPYAYNWNIPGGNTQTVNNLAAGSYSVTFSDANGCVGSVSGIIVTNPNAPTVTIGTTTNVSCNGGTDGETAAITNGGTAPYTYNWSNGTTSDVALGLAAGLYTVTVVDAASCAGVATVNISQPTAIAVALDPANSSNVACFGGSNGSIGITVSGATAPYSFNWSNGASTEDLVGLTAGAYTGSVTDANGCTTSATVTVTEPSAALGVSAQGTNANCNGQNGSATATATGGTAPYSYTWSNGANGATPALAAGTYTVTTTDANGCVASSSSVVITEPTAITASTSSTAASVAGAANGTATTTVSGGTSPYTYNWSNGANTANLTAVVAGNYTVTITDANGCTNVQNVTVADGPVAVGVTNANININMFPNPSTGSTTLTVRLVNNNDVNIVISNALGQVVRTINDASVLNNQYAINTTEWSAGVYFVKVVAGNDSATYKLTVK